jgi:hypothetical protein
MPPKTAVIYARVSMSQQMSPTNFWSCDRLPKDSDGGSWLSRLDDSVSEAKPRSDGETHRFSLTDSRDLLELERNTEIKPRRKAVVHDGVAVVRSIIAMSNFLGVKI